MDDGYSKEWARYWRWWVDSAVGAKDVSTGNGTDAKAYNDDKGREKTDIEVMRYKHMRTCPKTCQRQRGR
jgi:hypothetical protein